MGLLGWISEGVGRGGEQDTMCVKACVQIV